MKFLEDNPEEAEDVPLIPSLDAARQP
jgi:hypothetical protein